MDMYWLLDGDMDGEYLVWEVDALHPDLESMIL